MVTKAFSPVVSAAVLLLLLVSANAGAQAAQPAPAVQAVPAQSDWSKLGFLVGSWKGAGTGKPGEGASVCSFTFNLGNHVLVRKNRVDFPLKAGEKGVAVHEDLMVIYQTPGETSFLAIYWDNEGHTIRYALSFPAADKSVVFESEPADKGPRFKLAYWGGPGEAVAVEFAIAPPGAPYQTYTKGTMVKVR